MSEQMWFYVKNEQQFGPVQREEIFRLLDAGELTADDSIWTEGMDGWQAAGRVPEFAGVLPAGLGPVRPRCVTVLGILNIVFGGLTLLCSPLGIIALLAPQPEGPFVVSQTMKVFSLVGYAIGLVFAVVLVASGIGLLNLKKWARQAACIYAWVTIGWSIVATIINAFLLETNISDVPPEARPAMIGGMIGGVCGGMCVGLIYPIILLIFLRKPEVIEACSQ